MVDNKNNPKNEISPLFKRLTRLFSGPIVNYRAQSVPVGLNKRKLQKYANRFKSLAGFDFKSQKYNPFQTMQSYMMNQHNRGERYQDFDQMEYYPIIASAIDIYADEMSTYSELSPLLRIDCPNEEIKGILHTLFYDVLNVESNLYNWCRAMVKYGDFFLYLDIDEELGIKTAIGLPGEEIERLEGEDETNPNYVQFQWNQSGLTFENWQVGHFRILGNDKHAPYGTSVLEPARRIHRQLVMMEDAMMAYRIVRSSERRLYKVDVTGLDPEDVEQHVERIITKTKRHQVVDPDSGRIDLRYNPMAIEEDIYIPVREDSKSDVTILPGGQNTTAIEDVNYLKDNLFAALKIPKSYLSRGEGSEEEKGSLSQKDIRFAKTILRIQKSVVTELEKVAIVHLYTLGYRNDDVISFKLSLNNPSKLALLQELEELRTKSEIAASLTETIFSNGWIARNIFNLSDDEFRRVQYEKFYDKKFEMALGAVEQEPNFAGGGHGTSLGGAGSGGEVGEEFAVGDTALPMEDSELDAEPAGPEEKTPLLAEPEAAPAKRGFPRGDPYTTPAAKGKYYKPGTSDGRTGRGPRRKSMKSKLGMKAAGIPNRDYASRNKTVAGVNHLKTRRIAHGIAESKKTIYNELERMEKQNLLIEQKLKELKENED